MVSNKQKKQQEINVWKVATISLIMLFIVFIGFGFYEEKQKIINDNGEICNKIKATPAWINEKKEIVGYGVITINQSSKEFSDSLTELLIDKSITFVYNPDCSACQLQIKLFGEENFNRIKKRGLTIDCSK